MSRWLLCVHVWLGNVCQRGVSVGLKNIAEETTIEEGCQRMLSKEKPRVLEAEAARLVAKFGSETIRLIAWGQLVSVNLDFESDSDDEDSLY